MTPKNKKRLVNLVVHIVLILVTIFTVAPFFWMIATSLKTSENVMKMPPQWIPNPVTLENYVGAFEKQPLVASMVNSLLIAMANVFGTLLFAAMAGFAFAKIPFRGKKVLFGGLLATLMIPSQVALIPMYVFYSKIGWVDTYYPLILPGVLLNAYGVFMMRQFITGIPDSYIEAATIDGASYFKIFGIIILPLCKSILITLGLFNFIGSWNNFLLPLVMLNSPKKFTVPLLLAMYKTLYNVDWGLLMAASTVSVLPTVALFLAAQKFFVEGISLAGVKG